jgi:hypothetical protein
MYTYSNQGKYISCGTLSSTSWRVGRGGFTSKILPHLLLYTSSLGRRHWPRRPPKSPFTRGFTGVSCGIIGVLLVAADLTHPADLLLINQISYMMLQIKSFGNEVIKLPESREKK